MTALTLKTDKPILVTGGAGFIGSHLIDRLLALGSTVICIDNLNDFYNPEIKKLNRKSHEDHSSYIFYEGDIRDKDFVESVFREHEIGVIVHLAAMAGVRPSIETPELYTDVNINGTQTLLDVMKTFPVEKCLFASSSSVYGNNRKIPFSEDDNVDFQISPYGATKKMGEILAYTYHHLYDIPITCLRFFTVYGPRQRPEMAIHKFVRMILNDEPVPFFGDGSTARDYTYIDDIIDGILRSMIAEDDFAVYNLGNSERVKLSELVEIISEVVGKPVTLDMQELPPGDVVQTYADISRAQKRLDYKPNVRIADGISAFASWYEEMKQTYGELY